MKLAIALCLLLLLGTSAMSAEDDPNRWIDTCVGWNVKGQAEKSAYVLGWLRGIEAADKLTGDVILSYLWPTGYRVGGVMIEIDVMCQKRENKDLTMEAIMKLIVAEKNRLGAR